MGLPLVNKTVYWVEMHWRSSKEKVPGAALCKVGDVDSLGHERTQPFLVSII